MINRSESGWPICPYCFKEVWKIVQCENCGNFGCLSTSGNVRLTGCYNGGRDQADVKCVKCNEVDWYRDIFK